MDSRLPLRFRDELVYTAESRHVAGRHRGGLHVLLYDGRVRFVDDPAKLAWPAGELACLW